MNAARSAFFRGNKRHLRARHANTSRQLAFQPLESRRLLASIGDWAVIDLQSYLTDATTQFTDLSGVVFYGNQVAVTANVQPQGGSAEGRLLLVDTDLDAHTAQVADAVTIPALGSGKTEVLAVNSNDTVVYMTGSSVSPDAPTGEAFRAIWDGTQITNMGLGYIPGGGSEHVAQSMGTAVTPNGLVAGLSDNGHAIFQYDSAMVSAGPIVDGAVIYDISDDGVKVGIDIKGVIWEADNTTRREVVDFYGDGTYVFSVSPDHGVLVGSTFVFGVGGYFIEKLMWWDYDGTHHVIYDDQGHFIDGRLTSATNADVGYYVGAANPPSLGDILHIRSTNETVQVVDWFESLSGQSLPPQSSTWGPEIAYDYDTGTVAIISGGYLYLAQIWDSNQAPVSAADTYNTAVDIPLTVDAPGVLQNDTDDAGPLQAVLVSGPAHGTVVLNEDGSFVYTPDAGFNREDSFTYIASDGEYDSAETTVTINMDTPYPWHNGVWSLDVDDDNWVAPIDALQIINRLNLLGTGVLPAREHPFSFPFYDTVADNWVAPIDALQVINFLNLHGPTQGGGGSGGAGEGAGEGEGESLVHLAGGSAGAHEVLPSVLSDASDLAAGAPIQTDGALQRSAALAWSSDLREIGFASRTVPRDEELWAELAEQWGLTDLDDLLTVLANPPADRG